MLARLGNLESSWQQISLQKYPNYLVIFWTLMKNTYCSKNCCGYFLANFLKHLGLLFILVPFMVITKKRKLDRSRTLQIEFFSEKLQP